MWFKAKIFKRKIKVKYRKESYNFGFEKYLRSAAEAQIIINL